MNREPITLGQFTNESEAPRPKSICDVIIERVYCVYCSISYKNNNNLIIVTTSKYIVNLTFPLKDCEKS